MARMPITESPYGFVAKTETMKTTITAVMLVVVAAAMTGCENEVEKQHHLYNLQKCIAETNVADDSLKESSIAFDQAQHDWRAAQCMSVEEKTTVEYQTAKHDDYGKLTPATPTQEAKGIISLCQSRVSATPVPNLAPLPSDPSAALSVIHAHQRALDAHQKTLARCESDPMFAKEQAQLEAGQK
jgi:hypothetical protein